MSWMGRAARALGLTDPHPVVAGDLLEVKDAATRRASAGPTYVYGGHPYSSDWSVDRAVSDAYQRVIWVFKAIDAIADKASTWPIHVMEGTDPDWLRITDDPILPLLNARTNVTDGNAKFFRYRLSSQLLLSKAGVFVEVIPSKSGGIAALNLLPPARTRPIPHRDTFLAGFEVTHPSGDIDILPVYDSGKRRGVVWVRKPHPTDPYSGITPLESAGISIDLDVYARLYNRSFLMNDGRSGQLVAVKGGLSPEDAQELKARFSPGIGGAGRTTVIEAEAISVEDTAMTPRDAQYAELRGITKEDILIALGTPESVIGNASSRTFDNADAEKEVWLDSTVIGHTAVIEAAFDVLTQGGWDDGRQIVHDTSREPVLRRSQDKLEARARDDFDRGLITVDEYREVCKRDPVARPGSRVLWVAGGKVAVGADEKDEEAAGELKPVGGGSAAPVQVGMTPGEQAATARAGALDGSRVGTSAAARRRLELVKSDQDAEVKVAELAPIEQVASVAEAAPLVEPKMVPVASLQVGDVVDRGGTTYTVIGHKRHPGRGGVVTFTDPTGATVTGTYPEPAAPAEPIGDSDPEPELVDVAGWVGLG